MNTTKLTSKEKDVIYDALSNYMELIENAVLTDSSLDNELEREYREKLSIIEYLLTELSYDSGDRL